MLRVLDCSTLDSTYESFCHIYCTTISTIDEFFSNNTFEKYLDSHYADEVPFDSYLFDEFEKLSGRNGLCDRVHWFHATRSSCLVDSYEQEGILPLNLSIDRIWNFLSNLLPEDFSKDKWDKFCKDLSNNNIKEDFHVFHKLTYSSHGPFAFLVKDVVFRSNEGCHRDYFKGSEIVEDICGVFERLYGIDLHEAYLEHTSPCLVEFTYDDVISYPLNPALYYMYCEYYNKELTMDANTCFDGCGCIIDIEDIVSVEYFTDED